MTETGHDFVVKGCDVFLWRSVYRIGWHRFDAFQMMRLCAAVRNYPEIAIPQLKTAGSRYSVRLSLCRQP